MDLLYSLSDTAIEVHDLLNPQVQRAKLDISRTDAGVGVFQGITGDSNGDGRFDQQDIVRVLQRAKYLTARTALRSEGDWNGDRLFDQLDIVAALREGQYPSA